MQLEPGTTLDRYLIEGVLGVGGMAVVYRARHTRLGTPVALKVLSMTAPAIQERLLAEGRAQAALRHPNVVTVFDVIEVHGAPGLVMELVDGPSLATMLESRKLSLDQVDALAQGILAGVEAAHNAGLIHRDLKPGNVLLEVRAEGLRPKVTDFGLVKALDTTNPSLGINRTRSGIGMGTPAYMAPEQLRDARNVDQRADVFSLGAMLYEMATGEQAFTGGHLMAVYQAAASGKFVPPEELVPDLPPRMGAAIRHALQPGVAERTPSASALRAEWGGGEGAEKANVTLVGPWDPGLLAFARVLSTSSPEITAGSRPSRTDIAPMRHLETRTSGGSVTDTRGPRPAVGQASLSRSVAEVGAGARGQPPTGETFVPDEEEVTDSGAAARAQGDAFADPFAEPAPRRTGMGWLAALAGVLIVAGLAGATALALAVLRDGSSSTGVGDPLQEPAVRVVDARGETPESLTASADAAPPNADASPPGVDAAGALAEPAEIAAVEPEPVAGPTASAAAPATAASTPHATPTTATSTQRTAAPATTSTGSKTGSDATAGSDGKSSSDGASSANAGAAAKGTLTVNSVPYPDRVQLDGGRVLAARRATEVTAGSHQLTILASDGRTTTQTVTVDADQALVFCWDFNRSTTCAR